MNPTSIDNTQSNLPTWKRIKTQYVVTAAALALAASAAFAFSPSTSHKTAALTQATAPVATSLASPQAAAPQVIYMVGSAAEGEALKQQGKLYIVDGTTADQFQAPDAVRELMSNSPSFIFADLRSRAAPSPELERAILAGVISTEHATWVFDAAPVGPARQASEAEIQAAVFSATYGFDTAPMASARQASDADIMGGVISTEHAAYVFDAAPVAPARNASDADIMGGVISTEYATWGAPDATPQSRYASDADVMGGVISTERAAWVFDAAPVAPTRYASDADTMGGVISTEHARYIFTE